MTSPGSQVYRALSVLSVAMAAVLAAAAETGQPRVQVAQGGERAAAKTAATAPARERPTADEAEALFANGLIPRLRVDVTGAELEALKKNPRAFVRATVRETTPGKAERVFADVGVHLKGSAGSFRDLGDKPAITLSFGRFVKGQRFCGLDKLYLNNSVQDPSYLCENMGGSVFRAAGLPAPRVANARVWFNGRDLGFFVLKESFDGEFLSRNFQDRSGTVYEGTQVDIDGELPAKTNEARKNYAKLKELAAAASERDPALRRQRLEKTLDVDRFLTLMAIEAMLVHWDGYGGNRNNYRIYDDPTTGKLVFLPHGMDQLFQRPDDSLFLGAGMLARALTETPEDRSRYLERVAELRQRVFRPDALVKRLDEISARIVPVMEQISPEAARDHKDQAVDLRRRIIERVRNIDAQLAAVPRVPKFDAAGVAAIENWSPRQDGGNATVDRFDADGKARLRIRSGQGVCLASFRTTVLLPKGRYVLEGQCRAIKVAADDAPNSGVGLRISGGQRKTRLVGDTAWTRSEFEFDVTDAAREVILVCELRASSGEAWFDVESLKLRRR